MADESNMALRPMTHRVITTTTTATTTITAITTATTTITTTATNGRGCSVHLSKGCDRVCDAGLESTCSFIGFEFDSRPARLISNLQKILVETGSVPRKRGRKRSLSDVNGMMRNGEPVNHAIPLSVSENEESRSLTSLEKVFLEETNLESVDTKDLARFKEVFMNESSLENPGSKDVTSLGNIIIDERNLENMDAKGFTSLGKVIIDEVSLASTMKQNESCISVGQKSGGVNIEKVSLLSKSYSEVEDLCFINLCSEGEEDRNKEATEITILKELLRDKSFLSEGSVIAVSCINEETDPVQPEKGTHNATDNHKGEEERGNHHKKTEDHDSTEMYCKQMQDYKKSTDDLNSTENHKKEYDKKEIENHKGIRDGHKDREDFKQTQNHNGTEEVHKQTENCKKRTQSHKGIEEDHNHIENLKPKVNHKDTENQIEHHEETKDQKQKTENHEETKNQKQKTENHQRKKATEDYKEAHNLEGTKENHKESMEHKEMENQVANHKEMENHESTRGHKQSEPVSPSLDSTNSSPVVARMQENDDHEIYTLEQLVEVEQEGQYHLYGAPEYIEEVVIVEELENTFEEHQSNQSCHMSCVDLDHSYSVLPVKCLKDTFTPTEEERNSDTESCEIATEERVLEEWDHEDKSCETEERKIVLGHSRGSDDSDMKGWEAKMPSVGDSESFSSYRSENIGSEDGQECQEVERPCLGKVEFVPSYQSHGTGSEDSQKHQEAKSLCVGKSKTVSCSQSENAELEDSQKGQEAMSPCGGESKVVFSNRSKDTGSEDRQRSREAEKPCNRDLRLAVSNQSESAGSEQSQKEEAQTSCVTVSKAVSSHQSGNLASENPCMEKPDCVSCKSEGGARDVSKVDKTTIAIVPETTTNLSSPSGAVRDCLKNIVPPLTSNGNVSDPTNTADSVVHPPDATSAMIAPSSPAKDGLKNAVCAIRSNKDAIDVANTASPTTFIADHPKTSSPMSLRSSPVKDGFKIAVRATRSNRDAKDITNTTNTTTSMGHLPENSFAMSSPSCAVTDGFKNAGRATRSNRNARDVADTPNTAAADARHPETTTILSFQSAAVTENLKNVVRITRSNRDARYAADKANTTTPVTRRSETTNTLNFRSGTMTEGFRHTVRATRSNRDARNIMNTTDTTNSAVSLPGATSALRLPSSPVTKGFMNAVRATRSNSNAKDFSSKTKTITTIIHHPPTSSSIRVLSGPVGGFKSAVRITRSNSDVRNIARTSTTTNVIRRPRTTSALSFRSRAVMDAFKNAVPNTTSNGSHYPTATSPLVHSPRGLGASKHLQSFSNDCNVPFPTQGDTDILNTQNESQKVLDFDKVVLDDRLMLDSDKVVFRSGKEILKFGKGVLGSERVMITEHQEANQNHSCDSSTLESESKFVNKHFLDHQTNSSERHSCSNSKCSHHSSVKGNVDEWRSTSGPEKDIYGSMKDDGQEKAQIRTSRHSFGNGECSQHKAIEDNVSYAEEGRNTGDNDKFYSEGQRAGSQERTTIRSSIQLRKRKIYKLIEVPQRESINYDMISDLDSYYTNDTSSVGESPTKDKWLDALPDLFPSSKAEKKAINKIWQVLKTQLENGMKGVTTLPPPVCMRSKKQKRNMRGRGRGRGGRGGEVKQATPEVENKDAINESSGRIPEAPDSRVNETTEAKRESCPVTCSKIVPLLNRRPVCFCRYNTVLPLASRRTCCGRKRFKSGCRHSSRGSSREDMTYPTDKSLFFSNLGLMEKSQYDKDVYYKSLVTHRTRKVRAHQNKGKVHYRKFLDNLRGFCLDQNRRKLKEPLPLKFISKHKLHKLSTKGKTDRKVRNVDWIIDKCVKEHNFEGFSKAVNSKICSTRKKLSLQASPVRLSGVESLPDHSEALPPISFCCTDTNDNFTKNFNLPKKSGHLQSPLKSNMSDVEKCCVCEKSSDGLCSECCEVQKKPKELQSSLRSNELDMQKDSICEKSSDGMFSVEYKTHVEATHVRTCELHSKTQPSALVTQEREMESLRRERRIESTEVVDNKEDGEDSRLGDVEKGECTAEVGSDFSMRKRRKIDYGDDGEAKNLYLRTGTQVECAKEGDEDLRIGKGRKADGTVEFEKKDFNSEAEKTVDSSVGNNDEDFNLNRKNVESAMDFGNEDFKLLDSYSISEEEFSSLEEDSRMEEMEEETSTNTTTKGFDLKSSRFSDDSSNSSLPDLWSIGEKDVPSIHQALSTAIESPPQSDSSPVGLVVSLEQLRGLPMPFDEESEECDFLGFDNEPNYCSYEAISPIPMDGKDSNAISPSIEVGDEFAEDTNSDLPSIEVKNDFVDKDANTSSLSIELTDEFVADESIILPSTEVMDNLVDKDSNATCPRTKVMEEFHDDANAVLSNTEVVNEIVDENINTISPTIDVVANFVDKGTNATSSKIEVMNECVDTNAVLPNTEVKDKFVDSCKYLEPHKRLDDLSLAAVTPKKSALKEKDVSLDERNLDTENKINMKLPKISLMDYTTWGLKHEVAGNSIIDFELRPEDLEYGTGDITHLLVKEGEAQKHPTSPTVASSEKKKDLETKVPAIVDFELRPEDLEIQTKDLTCLSLKGTNTLKFPTMPTLVSPQTKESIETKAPEVDLTRNCWVSLTKIQIPESGLDGIKIGAEGSLGSLIFSNTRLSPKNMSKVFKSSERESETDVSLSGSPKDSSTSPVFSDTNSSPTTLTKNVKRSERETGPCVASSQSSESSTDCSKGVKRSERQPKTCINVSRSSERQNVRRIKYSELLKPRMRRSLNGLCSREHPISTQTAKHARSSSDGVILKCTICSLPFQSKAALNTHVETHKLPKEHECVECGLRFRVKASLNIHLETHKVQREYECAECGLRFTQKPVFESHLRLHSSARQLVSCEKCGACFSQLEDLRSHVKSHLSPRIQNCGVTCNYNTTLSDALNVDLKEGNGESMPCSGAFVVSPTVRRHTRMFGRGKEHHCTLCKVDTSLQGSC